VCRSILPTASSSEGEAAMGTSTWG
jgi:hypothetical protein